MNQTAKGIVYSVITAVCWAVLAIFLKYALTFADSGSIACLRMILAAAVLIVFIGIKEPSRLKIFLRPPVLMILGSLALAANYFGYMKGVELTGASNAQVMIQVGPLMLALSGYFIFREYPSPRQIFGFLLAVVGFGLFYWDQIHFSEAHLLTLNTGNAWILFAAVTWAFYGGVQKKLMQKIRPQDMNMVVYTICTICLLPVMDFSIVPNFDMAQWWIILFCGLNTVVAYGALGEALALIPAAHVSLIITMNPLLTIFLIQLMAKFNYHFIKHEPISDRGYLGALCVISGVLLTLLKPKAAKILQRTRTLQ